MSNFLKHFYNPSTTNVLTKYLSNFTQTKSIYTSSVSLIKLTNFINAEPTKAKKRVDPAILALRENRKRKRIEREIKKMEKFGRKLKPIEETEPDRVVLKEAETRKRFVRELTKEELDEEFFLRREWAKFINQQHNIQMEQINRALKSQQKALNELKKDNLVLYNRAIELDEKLIPYTREGPVHTPPNKAYEPPEGDYFDVTYLYDRR